MDEGEVVYFVEYEVDEYEVDVFALYGF